MFRGVPVRETRRYEKSVEGDLDFSEDKKLKLAKRRKRDTTTDVLGEERRKRGKHLPLNLIDR